MDDSLLQYNSEENELEEALPVDNVPVDPTSENTAVLPLRHANAHNSVSVKKPLTKWMIFCTENRTNIFRENPEFSFADVAKILAERYKVLSVEEHNRLDGLVKEDKERYLAESSANFVSNGHSKRNGTVSGGVELVFPLVSDFFHLCSQSAS
jgi:hypothetical protein